MKTRLENIQIKESSERTIFLTGGTGNIGAALIERLLTCDRSTRLILLVRGDSVTQAQERIENSLRLLSPQFCFADHAGRVTLLTGDITQHHLGLDPATWNNVASELTEIVHCAAATKFLLPLPCARTINVTGTYNVLTLAEAAHRHGRLRQIVHVSTAFVSGDRTGIIYEEDRAAPTAFANSYEQTKWEGEQLVRARMPELPITIARLSVVVGDSCTGRTLAFNVLYTPLRLIHDGKLKRIPIVSKTQLDVVPLDYVADALAHIACNYQQTVGRTFHLVAGAKQSLEAREIVKRAVRLFEQLDGDGQTFNIGFVAPVLYRVARSLVSAHTRRLWQLADPYLPYLTMRREFDHTNTDQLLGPAGITPPPLSDYLNLILQYALRCNWGRGSQTAQRAA